MNNQASFLAIDLHTIAYDEAFSLQERIIRIKQARPHEFPDVLLLLEHPPVITLGKRAHPENLLLTSEEYKKRGIELRRVNRGGDVTFHGPGQLVGYLLTHVPRFAGTVSDLVKGVGNSIQQAIQEFGVHAMFREDLPGVWIPDPPRKIAAIGMHITRGYSMHGFAINVTNDLRYFDLIIPCGIKNHGVTSLQALGIHVTTKQLKPVITKHLSKHFSKPITTMNKSAFLEFLESYSLTT